MQGVNPRSYITFILSFIVLFAVLSVSSCKDKETHDSTISGTLRHGQGYWFYLLELSATDQHVVDSVQLDESGEFSFNVSMSEAPQFYFLQAKNGDFIRLLVEKGEEVEVQANALHMPKTYVVANSPGSHLLWELQKMSDNSYARRDSIYLAYRGGNSEAKAKQARKADSLIQMVYKEHYESIKTFADENSESLASIFALYSQFDQQPVLNFDYDYALFVATAESLVERYAENSHARALYERIQDKEKEEAYAKERERLLSPGKRFPDFTLPNEMSEMLSLSQLESKVVVVSFWESQNTASWKLNEELKALDKKYKSEELVIVGVSMDKDKLAWKNAVALDNLSWPNVLGNHQVRKDYNLNELPRVFVLDSDLRIQAKDLVPDSLQTTIQRLL